MIVAVGKSGLFGATRSLRIAANCIEAVWGGFCNTAAGSRGRLEILKWAVENDCPYNGVSLLAAIGGNLQACMGEHILHGTSAPGASLFLETYTRLGERGWPMERGTRLTEENLR